MEVTIVVSTSSGSSSRVGGVAYLQFDDAEDVLLQAEKDNLDPRVFFHLETLHLVK